MRPLISIIVPVYNAEKTINRCIDALIAQDYKNIEIILVDDGSKDKSLEICRSYSELDQRIIVFSQQNGGVSSARNMGLENAHGDFVMFCDSDDWAHPSWCKLLLDNYIDGYLIMCGCFVEGKQNIVPHEIKSKISPYEEFEVKQFQALKMNFINVPWNKIFKREIIEKENIRFSIKLTNGEDQLFVLDYLTHSNCRIRYLSKAAFHYTWPTGTSLSSKVSENHLEQCNFWAKNIYKYIDMYPDMESQLKVSIYTDIFNQYFKGFCSCFSNKEKALNERLTLVNKYMGSICYQRCARNGSISTNRILNYLAKRNSCYWLYVFCKIRRII